MQELKRLKENDWELLENLEEDIKEHEKATTAYDRVSDDIGPDDPEFYNEDYGDGEDSAYELVEWIGEAEENIKYDLNEIKNRGYNLELLRSQSDLIDRAMQIIEND